MTNASPQVVCPRCSSPNIEPMPPAPREDSDALTADVAPATADPPNMRCNACGHTWWVPPPDAP